MEAKPPGSQTRRKSFEILPYATGVGKTKGQTWQADVWVSLELPGPS